jgi:hypothetical protein
MIVPMTETKSEPRQPKRFEKKANIHAISRWKPERRLPMPLFHCAQASSLLQIHDLTAHCFSIKNIIPENSVSNCFPEFR